MNNAILEILFVCDACGLRGWVEHHGRRHVEIVVFLILPRRILRPRTRFLSSSSP